MVLRSPTKDTDDGPYEGVVYACTLQGETYKEHDKLTATYGELYGKFGRRFVISGDTLIVWAWGKGGHSGGAYALVFAEDGSWDEGDNASPTSGWPLS